MKYQIALNKSNMLHPLVQVLASAAAIPGGFTKVGEFDHPDLDLIGAGVSHVIYQHVQDALYFQGIYDMQPVDITWPGKVVATAVTVPDQVVIVGTETPLTATTTPATVSRARVTWITADDKVAHINSRGLLVAQSVGKTKGTVQVVDGGAIKQFNIEVKPKGYVAPTSIAVTPAGTSTLTVAAPTVQLVVAFTPSTATDKRVTYVSNTPSVATVSATGLVTRVSNGSATITVTTMDGGKTTTKAITCTA